MKLVQFYRDRITSDGGYHFSEVRKWGLDEWEASHQEIQWMFPTKQASMMNDDAPTLTDDEITLFKYDPELRKRFLENLEGFLRIYGIKRIEDHERTSPSGEWMWIDDKVHPWIKNFNHNFLRFSRIMDCMCKFGDGWDAQELSNFLMNTEGADISKQTRTHWDDAAWGRK